MNIWCVIRRRFYAFERRFRVVVIIFVCIYVYVCVVYYCIYCIDCICFFEYFLCCFSFFVLFCRVYERVVRVRIRF